MKRRICHFLLCCGIAGLATTGRGAASSTNSSGATNSSAAAPATNHVEANLAVPAVTNAAASHDSKPEQHKDAQPAAPESTNHETAAPGITNKPQDHASIPTNREPAGMVASAGTNAAPLSASNGPDPDSIFQINLDLAREQRRNKILAGAAKILEDILTTNAPPAIQRAALFELALVMQDDGKPARAQQIWAQYVQRYTDDSRVPDVLLRQGLLYRKMGVDEFAISKFYAVMSSALKLKQDNMAYYKTLVVQAQTEIADTYFQDAKFDQAADFFNRILKSGDAESNREELEWKLIRSLSYLTNHVETIGKAQSFLTRFPKSPNSPEVRFLLAGALKSLNRNQDAIQQVLLLLQSQQENAGKDPETWAYWQRRAGNEIANQLYKEADYLDALEIYLSLADLDKSAAWQAPVWYQAALVYEQLQQWQKATDTYNRILDRQKELTDANSPPALTSLLEMAKWRKDYIAWMQKAKLSDLALRPSDPTNSPHAQLP
jgi:tetratricopeptide (TPR) repeat protein